MSETCTSCGAVLQAEARFCSSCGERVEQAEAAPDPPKAAEPDPAAAAEPDPFPEPVTEWEEPSRPSPPPLAPELLAAICVGVLLVLALGGAWWSGWFSGDHGQDAEMVQAETSEGDDDGPLPPEWFAAYRDRFLSDEVVMFVALAGIMYATRRVDWSAVGRSTQEQLAPA